MNKKIVVGIEIFKTLIQVGLIGLVYRSAVNASCNFDDMQVMGQFFLITLGVVLVSGILLDIVINIVTSFFVKPEKGKAGEWEKFVNKNIVVHFAYALSVFFVGLMTVLALGLPMSSVLLTIRIGFVILMIVVNSTKVYHYYE